MTKVTGYLYMAYICGGPQSGFANNLLFP